MLPTKIVVIGAGSAIFGLNTISALMGSQRLRGSQLALVDRNTETLALIAQLAERLNRGWDAQMVVTTHTHHAQALDSAEFVVSAIDPNGDTMTFSADNLPDGASFDPDTRTFSWTPGINDVGTYEQVFFEVSDGVIVILGTGDDFEKFYGKVCGRVFFYGHIIYFFPNTGSGRSIQAFC